MNRPSDYFEKIYVIHLPERTDRLRDVTGALERAGLSWRSDKVELFPAIKMQDAAGFASAGLRGCFLSHLAVLQQAHALQLPNVLILEDDVEFSSVLIRVWGSIEQQLRTKPWSLLYLGYAPFAGTRYATHSTTHIELRAYTGPLQCLHAYAVNGPTILPLLNYLAQMPERAPGDPDGSPISPDGGVNLYRHTHPEQLTLIADPQVAWQRASYSDAHGRGWRNTRAARTLLAPARRGKNWLRRQFN